MNPPNVATLFATKPSSPKGAYAAAAEAMTDDALAQECRQIALLAAFASEDLESSFHWKKAICAAQADLRGRPDIFERAFADAVA